MTVFNACELHNWSRLVETASSAISCCIGTRCSKAAMSTYWKEVEVLGVSPNFGHGLHLMVIIYGVVRAPMAAAPRALHPFPLW